MTLHSILTKVFGVPEEINGRHRCPTYLYRWFLLRTPWFKAYLHHFVGDDWSLDLHDHPKRFISIGLKGAYIEETPYESPDSEWARLGHVQTVFRAPWVRSFSAEHVHRVKMLAPGRDCWTFVLVLRGTREWGFWHQGSFIHWKEYVFGSAAHIADARTACEGVMDSGAPEPTEER